MALDSALLDRAARTGDAVLRVYTWERPTLSLGRNQRALGSYSAALAEAEGVPVVRRPTGGRALVHARELTYSVTAPAAAGEPLRVAYERVNRLLVGALATLGVPAGVAGAGSAAPPPSDAPCFETPVRGELVANGRKLAGSAQWRDERAWLQHGSILVDDDQPLLARLATAPIPNVPPPATLRALLGRAPAASELMDALAATLRAGGERDVAPLYTDPLLDADALRHERFFDDPAWTWRR